VWALGCLFYSYCFGYSPYECAFHQGCPVPYVVECSYLRILGKIPHPTFALSNRDVVVLDLVSWMLNQVPNLRPFCSDVLSRLELIGSTANNITAKGKAASSSNKSSFDVSTSSV
jgi:hypothetical protein